MAVWGGVVSGLGVGWGEGVVRNCHLITQLDSNFEVNETSKKFGPNINNEKNKLWMFRGMAKMKQNSY